MEHPNNLPPPPTFPTAGEDFYTPKPADAPSMPPFPNDSANSTDTQEK